MGSLFRRRDGGFDQVIGMYRQVDGVFKPIVKVLHAGTDGAFNTIVFGTASVPSFADATYEELDLIASSGNASSYWSIGDTRTLTLSTGEIIELRIEDFNHDDLVGGGKAGITIGTTQLLDDQAYMNLTAVNAGGWTSSNIRTTTLPAIFETLPSELQAIIKPVVKVTQAGGGSSDLSSTADSLWLFSYTEAGGVAAAYSPGEEGYLYPLYDTDDSATRIKARTSGADAIWWFRSPYLGDTSSFTYATATGSFYRNRANISGRYISFGFCIGGSSSQEVDGYQLQSITLSSNAYFNTNYYPVPSATDTHCFMAMTSETHSTRGVFGTRASAAVANTSYNVFWDISSYPNRFRFDVLGTQVYSSTKEINTMFEFHNYSQDKTIVFDGETYSGTTEMTNVRATTPYLIGTFYNVGSVYATTCPMTIGSQWDISEWVDGIEVPQRSYVPWFRTSDNVACLRDTLTGEYLDAVTGTVTAGDAVQS